MLVEFESENPKNMSKPCSQLNSKLIRDTAECQIITAVQKQCSVVAFKCIWRVNSDQVERAWRWVCDKRDDCDKKLLEMKEISFFFSAISTSKLQAPKQDGDDLRNDDSNEETVVSASQLSSVDQKIFPAITYWAACQTPNGAAVNPLKLQQALVKCGVEVYMCKSSTKKGCQRLNQLCQALKDHKNPCLMDLVASSYQHCLRYANITVWYYVNLSIEMEFVCLLLSNLESEMGLDSSIDYDASNTENVVRLRVKEQRMKTRLII